jgi:hypothetical protein
VGGLDAGRRFYGCLRAFRDGNEVKLVIVVQGAKWAGRGRGSGARSRNDGARLWLRLRLGVGTSIPHCALSLSSLHCGRLLFEVGLWRVGSTVAESSAALCEPTAHGVRRAGAAFAIDRRGRARGGRMFRRSQTSSWCCFCFPCPWATSNECLPLQTSRHSTYSI